MRTIVEKVNQLFIAVDACDWDMVQECFAESIDLDYSSMNGQPAAVLKSSDIIAGWKSVLPGFTHTHHQTGNFITTEDGDTAYAFCYGTATHYLESEGGNLWTVVGSYDIDLKIIDGDWRITKIKLNFKYQDGNTRLPELAMEALK